MIFGIIAPIDIAKILVDILEGVEDALVVDGLREDGGNDRAIILAQIGNNNLGMIAFGTQSEQKGLGTGVVVIGVDGDMQEVVSPDIDSQIDIHPAAHLGLGFVIFGNQNIFFIDTDNPARFENAKQSRHRQQIMSPLANPTPSRHTMDVQSGAGTAISGIAPGIHLQSQDMILSAVGRVGQEAGREIGEGFGVAQGVAAEVAIHFHFLKLALRIVVFFEARFLALWLQIA